MKNLKVLAAAALIGLVGLSAQASTLLTNVDLINVKLTILVQTNNTFPGTYSEKFNVTTVKVINKDVLKVIAKEFTNSAAAITDSGSRLAVNNFFSGIFEVISKTNTVILANASSSTNDPAYKLAFGYSNYVYTGSYSYPKDVFTKEMYNYTTIATLNYSDAAHANFFNLNGSATVKDTYVPNFYKDSESFGFSGTGDGQFNASSAVVGGAATGSGSNNSTID